MCQMRAEFTVRSRGSCECIRLCSATRYTFSRLDFVRFANENGELHIVHQRGSVQRSLCSEVVTQNCVVIFSKTTCPYCKMAKNVFNEIGANYKVVELDEHNDGRRLQEALAQMTGARTVPRVFINGNCIGGGSDTKQLHQQGKLVPLIEQCAPCCAASGSDGSGSGQFESAK
ncbi:hypothetical protein F2P81_005296 [Scophthalmus maximus]|uniref:Glutaredoxin-2, mitochondrial n=1 Tax=Scophthalmus maximus TaxID=52904 RepID=A0A6A4TEW3_SCOMX|nr:hypothetical protein F2P81_005296 [Scophthalmus maximus]